MKSRKKKTKNENGKQNINASDNLLSESKNVPRNNVELRLNVKNMHHRQCPSYERRVRFYSIICSCRARNYSQFAPAVGAEFTRRVYFVGDRNVFSIVRFARARVNDVADRVMWRSRGPISQIAGKEARNTKKIEYFSRSVKRLLFVQRANVCRKSFVYVYSDRHWPKGAFVVGGGITPTAVISTGWGGSEEDL